MFIPPKSTSMKIAILLLFFPVTLYAQNNTSLFDAYMKAETDLYRFNGNVLVSKNGNVIYKKSFGYADFDKKIKLDSNSIFDCGSISKEFTAMGILLLKDKGMISYTDTLRKFFPELPYTHVTIQQLLTHTSGLPDGFGLVAKYFDHSKIASNGDMIRLLAREKPPVLFKPGEDLMYSGTAFIMLASIIEKITGQSYNAFIEDQIFKPLGLTHTQVVNRPRPTGTIPGYANGYVYSDSLKNYQLAENLLSGWSGYLSGFTGEGMIITTTGDLLKWDRALKNHSLLNEATQQAMISSQAEKKTFPFVHFGYGIRVGKNYFGKYIFHNGSYPGYISMLICYNDIDLTVVVLSNNESRAEFIADGLACIALNGNFVMPYVHHEIVIEKAPDTYTGKYMMPLTRPPYMVAFPIELVNIGSALYVHSGSMKDIELKPESATKFFFADGTDQQLEFETDNNGVLKIWYVGWGLKREIQRME